MKNIEKMTRNDRKKFLGTCKKLKSTLTNQDMTVIIRNTFIMMFQLNVFLSIIIFSWLLVFTSRFITRKTKIGIKVFIIIIIEGKYLT
ncbi:MAG: hypothetical protein J7J92_02450 [Candidatus Aenigmarchaeota archaeon]|nr:hypothetical protein [Candidatus Aenigmarchaeota archaeon]